MTAICFQAALRLHFWLMIRSFRNKELAKLWAGDRSKIDQRLHQRLLQRLDRLEQAGVPEDMNLPGFNFHGLEGKPKRYSVHVNGPWCVTFEFKDGQAEAVDFEQYH